MYRVLLCAGLVVAAFETRLGAQEKDLAQQAKAILKAACYRCHGEKGAVEGGFNYVLDRDHLVARNRIIPGDPKKSKLLKRIIGGDMPPENEKPRPTAEDIKVLEAWVAAGAPDFNPQMAKRDFISPEIVLEKILEDINKRPERDRRFARYFSITHLFNAGLSEDELDSYRQALSKLVNSLSWGSRISVPRPIDPQRTIFGIDLRDYKWSEKTWEKLAAQYTYGWVLGTQAERSCQETTGCKLPCVRADWFVASAAHPPLYHDLLQLPDTDEALEKELRVDVLENIKGERLLRAGFNSSGVSRNNRLIERHETAFGAYWKSYDFGGNSGRQNLFAQPLGPNQLVSGDNTFQHDGGEIIFNLPNGLQAYMLVDGRGRRIDKGPTEIVSDPRRPDRAVVNGLSCMSCHARGMIPKEDQVRAHVEKNRNAFTKTELETILAIYPPREKMTALMEEDLERFRRAVEKTGTRLAATEPVVALALRFEAEIDAPMAAAEVGLAPAAFIKALAKSPELARTIGPLTVEGGTIQRQVFTQSFSDIVRALRGGAVLDGLHLPTKLFPKAPVRFLSELEEFDVRSGQFPFKKGDTGEGKPIRVAGVLSPHGLGMHPPVAPQIASVKYRLGKEAEIFQATVAIDDSTKWCFSPATFAVLGDGRLLFQSGFIAHNHARSQECRVNVRGVNVLELRVGCQNFNKGVHAVWVEPRVLQKSDSVAEASPGRDPTKPPPAGKPLPAFSLDIRDFLKKAVQNKDFTKTNIVGFGLGDLFEEVPAEGGLLIGFEVGMGKSANSDVIHSLRPIFWTEQGELLGGVHGQPGEHTVTVKAKPGYAVGAVDISSRLLIDHMTITFMRLNKKALDATDKYQSEPVGSGGGGRTGAVGGTGALVIGICGKTLQNQCRSLGLVLAGNGGASSPQGGAQNPLKVNAPDIPLVQNPPPVPNLPVVQPPAAVQNPRAIPPNKMLRC